MDRDEALSALFAAHYDGLLRLAVLLVDPATAEDVVQDAFARLHARWRGLRDHDKALAYLRASVVNGARSRLRRNKVAARYEPPREGWAASAEDSALDRAEHADVLAALDRLPRRQREVLVLRYYLDLREADIADTLGISPGSVKQHASRGLAALSRSMEAVR